MPRRLGIFVSVAMVLGVLVGFVLNQALSAADAKAAAANLSIVTDQFLRLIKMIIAPLVFSTLVVGIAHMEDTAAIGRVGIKTLAWFVSASIVSLSLGLMLVQLLHPGAGMALPHEANASGGVDAGAFTLKDFLGHVIPTSIFDAMARNEILQIVVFSIFIGTAISSLEPKAPALLEGAEQLAAVMLKVTGYVMLAAPIAIFAALAATVATQGLAVLVSYAKFVVEFYLSLALLWGLLVAVAALAVGRRTWALVKSMQPPMLMAFSTASSEAAFPLILEGLTRFGLPRRYIGRGRSCRRAYGRRLLAESSPIRLEVRPVNHADHGETGDHQTGRHPGDGRGVAVPFSFIFRRRGHGFRATRAGGGTIERGRGACDRGALA